MMNKQLLLFDVTPYERKSRMSQLVSVSFWKLAAERAAKTAAQTAVALIGAEAFDVVSYDWGQLASVSAGAAVVSLLTSVASADIGPKKGDPSLV